MFSQEWNFVLAVVLPLLVLVVGIGAGIFTGRSMDKGNPTSWNQLPMEEWYFVHSVHVINRNYFAVVQNKKSKTPTFISLQGQRIAEFKSLTLEFKLTYVEGKKWLYFT